MHLCTREQHHVHMHNNIYIYMHMHMHMCTMYMCAGTCLNAPCPCPCAHSRRRSLSSGCAMVAARAKRKASTSRGFSPTPPTSHTRRRGAMMCVPPEAWPDWLLTFARFDMIHSPLSAAGLPADPLRCFDAAARLGSLRPHQRQFRRPREAGGCTPDQPQTLLKPLLKPSQA